MGKIIAGLLGVLVVVLGIWWFAAKSSDRRDDAPSVSNQPAVAEEVRPEPDPTMVKPHALDEISGHSSKENCWVVVRETVYNISSLLEDAADRGGMEGIEGWCGKDVTAEFTQKYAGKEDPERVLGNNQIGLLSK